MLVLVTVLTLLAGTLLAVYDVQYRFIRRDAHRLQARYSAEAAVYIALDSLQRDPAWRVARRQLGLPLGRTAEVTVEPFGGYLLVRAIAREHRSRVVLRALVGERPPSAFDAAIYLWDTESTFNLAGTTRINGDVVVGERGVEESEFKGRRFTGRLDGRVHRTRDLAPAYFSAVVFNEVLVAFDTLLAARTDAPAIRPEEAGPEAAWQLPGENEVLVTAGDVRLTSADSMLLAHPVTVVATRDLVLEGPLAFAPGSVFAAGRGLTLQGRVEGREGLFYGREGVDLWEAVTCAGQFLSRAGIRVHAGAYLAYPSTLFVTGEAAALGGRIEVADSAVVDGTLIHPVLSPRPDQPRGRIVVAPEAQVRGSIYSGLETELHGTLYGSLLTRQLYFYHSPSHYVNWLKDATVEAVARPASYVLPVGFSQTPRLTVLSWDAHVEEVDDKEEEGG